MYICMYYNKKTSLECVTDQLQLNVVSTINLDQVLTISNYWSLKCTTNESTHTVCIMIKVRMTVHIRNSGKASSEQVIDQLSFNVVPTTVVHGSSLCPFVRNY